MFLKGAGQQRLPAGDGRKALQLDELGQHLAGGVVAQGEVYGEEVRPLGLVWHFKALGNGRPRMLAELRPGQLADDVIRGADQRARRGLVEEQR
jgi:hypothetical protein